MRRRRCGWRRDEIPHPGLHCHERRRLIRGKAREEAGGVTAVGGDGEGVGVGVEGGDETLEVHREGGGAESPVSVVVVRVVLVVLGGVPGRW